MLHVGHFFFQVYSIALEKCFELHMTTALDDGDFSAHLPQTLRRISQAFAQLNGPARKHKTQLLLHAVVIHVRLMILANHDDGDAATIFEEMKDYKDANLANQLKAALKNGAGRKL